MVRIMLWICVDNLTRIQDRLAQGLIHSHNGRVLNLCLRKVWVQHVVVSPQRSGHVMLVSGLTLNRPGRFNLKFTRERRAAARRRCVGQAREVGKGQPVSQLRFKFTRAMVTGLDTMP